MNKIGMFAVMGVVSLFSVSGAMANEQEVGACKEDVKRLCGEVKPGGGAIKDCIKSHESELSTACKEKMASRKKHFEEKKQEVMTACAADIKQYCTGVTPGEGREWACLKSYEDKLSAGCKEKLPRGMHHGKGMKGPMGDKPEPLAVSK